MVRRSKLLLGLVVVGVSALVALAYGGVLESVVSAEQLPGPPPVGGVIVLGVVLFGFLGANYLDRRAWTAAGRGAGLSPGDVGRFAGGRPEDADGTVLGGVSNGRPVRAWHYSVSGGRNSNSRTYTVVEAALGDPVDWHAAFGAAGASTAPDDPGIDAAQSRTIDGVGVRGDVPDPVARDVLTASTRDALSSVEGEVAIGDAHENVVDGMADALDEAEGGMAASVASGMLNLAGGGGDPGPSRTVQHRDRGLLTDEAALRNRVGAVVRVADAVDAAAASTDGPVASPE